MYMIEIIYRHSDASTDFFSFKRTPLNQIYTLSLHDALPIYSPTKPLVPGSPIDDSDTNVRIAANRSEEHTSELQSRGHLVCRFLHEKKNNCSLRSLH